MQPTRLSSDTVSPSMATAREAGTEAGSEAFGERLGEAIEAATGGRLGKAQIRELLDGEAAPDREQLLALLSGELAGPDAGVDADSGDAGRVDVAAWVAALVDAQRFGGGGDNAASLKLAEGSGAAGDRLARFLQSLAAAGTDERGGGSRDPAFEALLGSAETRPASARAGAATPTLQLATPVNQPGFTRGVAEQITWMVRNDTQSARVTLDPPDLGPLEISVATGDDRASVSIVAHHAGTREALMADSARLRAMLADSGFADADVSIRDGDAGSDGAQGFDRRGGGAHGGDGRGASTEIEERPGGGDELAARGLVDHYV